jgi:hypothetical protein
MSNFAVAKKSKNKKYTNKNIVKLSENMWKSAKKIFLIKQENLLKYFD